MQYLLNTYRLIKYFINKPGSFYYIKCHFFYIEKMNLLVQIKVFLKINNLPSHPTKICVLLEFEDGNFMFSRVINAKNLICIGLASFNLIWTFDY